MTVGCTCFVPSILCAKFCTVQGYIVIFAHLRQEFCNNPYDIQKQSVGLSQYIKQKGIPWQIIHTLCINITSEL
jgi:hypothetical protein